MKGVLPGPKPTLASPGGIRGEGLADLSNKRVLLSYLSFSGIPRALEKTPRCLHTGVFCSKKENYTFAFSRVRLGK
jgi:hypothetical protein